MHKKNELEYGKSLYETDELKYWAKRYVKHLPDNVDTLLSMGSSGCAIATAMLMVSKRKLNHIYLKKKSEHSHSDSTYNIRTGLTIAIVDDFISSGATIKNIFERYNEIGDYNRKGNIKDIKYIIVSYGNLVKKGLSKYKVKLICTE